MKTDMKGKGIEIRRLQSGETMYRVHFRAVTEGKRKQQSKTFGTIEEALAFREKSSPKGVNRFRQRLTVTDFITGFYNPHAEGSQKASTLRSEASRIKHYILPAFGGLFLDNWSPAHWAAFQTTVRGVNGQALSAKTLRNLFTTSHAILQLAVELSFLEKNPLARPNGSRENKLCPRKAARKEKPILSPDQFGRLLRHLPEHWHPLVWTFAITGLRASEVAGLRWSDYSKADHTLTVQRGVVRGVVDSPKTEATARKVGGNSLLAEMLERQRIYSKIRLQREPGPNDYIFSTPSGNPFNADTARREILYPAMRKVGIVPNGRQWGWHCFRHSCATAHLNVTGDIYRTSRYLGHADVRITQKIYTHLKPAPAAEAELLATYWSGSLAVPFAVPLQTDKVQ